jgi:RNA polymerase sigma-70 factor (ECF subfamily)
MKDCDIINGFLRNDQKVISDFYEEFKFRFCTFFRARFAKDEAYVNDLYQDTCAVFWNNIQTGKLTTANLNSSISTYLISVGKYTLMAKDRKYKEIVNDDVLIKLNFVEDDAEELKAKIEREDFVERMVSEMKPPCSDLLKAFYWDKLSGDKIAQKLNFSNAESVKSQKYKCMKKIKPLLTAYMNI